MSRYTGPSWKVSRRLGYSTLETGRELAKRDYAPGAHGNDRRKKKSEYGLQLAEKQKLRMTYGGYGHTSGIYVDEIVGKEKIDVLSKRMKTCRILVNTPAAQGGIGDLYNFMLNPSLTLGCGSWGGNSVSENVTIKHFFRKS